MANLDDTVFRKYLMKELKDLTQTKDTDDDTGGPMVLNYLH